MTKEEEKRDYDKKYNEIHKEKRKEYRESHKKEKKEYDKNYCEINREKKLRQTKEYYKKNKKNVVKGKKRYYLKNKKRILLRAKIYRETFKGKLVNKIHDSKRRALKRNTQVEPISVGMLQSRFKLLGNKCVYCGVKGNLTIDHIVPLSKGGPHAIENIVPACGHCNCSKHSRLLQDWKPEIIPILEEKIKIIEGELK